MTPIFLSPELRTNGKKDMGWPVETPFVINQHWIAGHGLGLLGVPLQSQA